MCASRTMLESSRSAYLVSYVHRHAGLLRQKDPVPRSLSAPAQPCGYPRPEVDLRAAKEGGAEWEPHAFRENFTSVC